MRFREGNMLHIDYRREDPGCGVVAHRGCGATLCGGCDSCLLAPLNALGSGISIWVK